MSKHCPGCGRFMALTHTLTWEIDRMVPDKKWACSNCDIPTINARGGLEYDLAAR